MQKKMIVLAIASVLAAPAAFAADASNVTVYGKVDMAFGSTDSGTARNTQVSSQVTKVGFKGAEDLGDGLSAIWQIEQQIDIDNAGGTNSTKNTLASRNSFLGLKSNDMGTVLLGRHDTPYKIATRGLDVFGDQFADNRQLMGGLGQDKGGTMDARPTNVVAYISPAMNGFKAAVAYAVNTEVATAGKDKGSIWSLAGMYDQDGIYGAVGYQTIKYTNVAGTQGQFVGAAGDRLSAWKIGGGYKVEAFNLGAVYEKTSSSIGGLDTLGRTNYTLAGQYNFSNNDVKLSYTHAGNTNGVGATGANMIGVGFDHNFSKRTSLYAQYAQISNNAGAAYTFGTGASTAAIAGVAAGGKPSGFMVGVKHTF